MTPPTGRSPSLRVGARLGAWAVVVIFVSFVVYAASPVRLETDSFWAVFTARSLVAQHDADLDEYRAIIRRGTGFQVEEWNGHAYYEAPLATSLAAVPFVAVDSLLEGHGLDQRLASGHAQPLDGIIAAALAAIATGLMFLVLSRLDSSDAGSPWSQRRPFAFGTQVWSTASRTMWMHGPSLVCLTLALLLALHVRRSRRVRASRSVRRSASPTSCDRRTSCHWSSSRSGLHCRVDDRSSGTLCGAAMVGASFLVLDLLVYGRAVQPYFRASRLGLSATTVEALLGNLVSPARGLLVFVPVSLFCAYGVILKRRRGVRSRRSMSRWPRAPSATGCSCRPSRRGGPDGRTVRGSSPTSRRC